MEINSLISAQHLHEGEMELTYEPAERIKNEKLVIGGDILDVFKQNLSDNDLYIDDDEVILEIIVGIIKGNIIIQGPPGTGKTAISKVICDTFNVESIVETAIDDWTTYDTIGGFFPDVKDGQQYVTGRNGRIVQSIVKCCETIIRRERSGLIEEEKAGKKQASWLIIDELNRAEIDKVFGDMFTILGSGDSLGERKLKLDFQENGKKELYVPNRYRIIGLMNNVDKNYVYDLSQALSRRFSFVTLMPPKEESMPKELEVIKGSLHKRIMSKIEKFGDTTIDEQLINESILKDELFVKYEKDLIDILKHVRYAEGTEGPDEAFLGAEIGTAIVKDLYEAIVVRLIVMNYMSKNTVEKEVLVKKVIDGAIATNLLSQIDSQNYDKKQNFVNFFKEKREWEWCETTIRGLINLSL